MNDAPHPIVMLIVVLVLGLLVWPWLKFHNVAPRGAIADAILLCALIGGYYFYKGWWEKNNPKK